MRASRPITALIVALLLIPTPAVTARDRALELHENLPRDPLMVLGMSLEDPQREFRGLVDALGRFAPRSIGAAEAASLLDLDDEQLSILHADLVPSLGSEMIVSVDFPPIDEAITALHFSRDEAWSTFLGGVGLLGRVQDAPRLDRALRKLILSAGGEIVEADEMTRASLPLGTTETGATIKLPVYYSLRDKRWAFGFSSDWVHSALEPRPKGLRLVDGDDFKTVFARLDPRPTDLTYVNLPKLRAYVTGSQIVQMVLQTNTEFREFVNGFFTAETMNVGLGSTSVRMNEGVRTMHFGPRWMSGAAVSSGFVAALALPNLMAAIDRGKTKQTLSDIHAIARACEGFSGDSRIYPGPTDGWVPVDRIATFLEPVYIGQLPRTDGWENPILYWSDGGSYRILSMGRDGTIDRDWTGPVDPLSSASQDADIVFGDGRLLAWPSGMESD